MVININILANLKHFLGTRVLRTKNYNLNMFQIDFGDYFYFLKF
jgi:hypothetical protein